MTRTGSFAIPDQFAMRRTMGRFLTGVAVVSTLDERGEPNGMTINSLTSISLAPPILMIALNFDTRTGNAIKTTGRFAISVLGVKQEAAARYFATRGGERFKHGEFEKTEGGIPVLAGALSQAECEVVKHEVVGDHDVFFGEVVACRDRDGDGLAFNAGKFGSFNDFGHDELPWRF